MDGFACASPIGCLRTIRTDTGSIALGPHEDDPIAGRAAVPALDQGTWMMAERPYRRAQEITALREGLDVGMTLIDTAETYARARHKPLQVFQAVTDEFDVGIWASRLETRVPSDANRCAGIRISCPRASAVEKTRNQSAAIIRVHSAVAEQDAVDDRRDDEVNRIIDIEPVLAPRNRACLKRL